MRLRLEADPRQWVWLAQFLYRCRGTVNRRMTDQLHTTAKQVDEEKQELAEGTAAGRGSITSSADMKKEMSSSINLDE